jgi:hypothetical protein
MGLTNIGFGEIDDTDEVIIPNLIGVPEATAQGLITSLNLVWSITTENTADANLGGKVKSQNPVAGTKAEYYTGVSAVIYNYVAPYSFTPVYYFVPVYGFTPVYGFSPYGFSPYGFTPQVYTFTPYSFTPYGFAPRFR